MLSRCHFWYSAPSLKKDVKTQHLLICVPKWGPDPNFKNCFPIEFPLDPWETFIMKRPKPQKYMMAIWPAIIFGTFVVKPVNKLNRCKNKLLYLMNKILDS